MLPFAIALTGLAVVLVTALIALYTIELRCNPLRTATSDLTAERRASDRQAA
jgi:hypothetical protein